MKIIRFLKWYKSLDYFGRLAIFMVLLIPTCFLFSSLVLARHACIEQNSVGVIISILYCCIFLYLACRGYFKTYSLIEDDSRKFL